ncbi:MerR family transcriptional regulator [Millisia brevis]|uniref:MerR family transcriptional regulator n=1 Tax=Millisia brevis TaxID=264148 RepID=UPI0008339651|nr:MerR family transcriptional regulator [Millisia brevis]
MAAAMRMAELSSKSGVSVASIKLYLREGVLPAGRHTSPNQAFYDDHHLQRLTLIRALREIAGLPLASIRAIAASLDNPETELFDTLRTMQSAIIDVPESAPDDHLRAEARRMVDDVVAERGWKGASPQNPSRSLVEATLARILAVGADPGLSEPLLDAYARAAEVVAGADLAGLRDIAENDRIIEVAVIWTVLGDSLLAGLRGMAHEVVSRRELIAPPEPCDTPNLPADQAAADGG